MGNNRATVFDRGMALMDVLNESGSTMNDVTWSIRADTGHHQPLLGELYFSATAAG
jgi:hypothetical protein